MFRTGKKKAFSFIELMLTVVVLSSGIAFIYKAFFMSLTSFNHLTNRLFAMDLTANQIASLRENFGITKDLTGQLGRTIKTITLDGKSVEFVVDKSASALNSNADLYELEVLTSWKEGRRDFKISQSAYVGGF